jgi:hypothetical protein
MRGDERDEQPVQDPGCVDEDGRQALGRQPSPSGDPAQLLEERLASADEAPDGVRQDDARARQSASKIQGEPGGLRLDALAGLDIGAGIQVAEQRVDKPATVESDGLSVPGVERGAVGEVVGVGLGAAPVRGAQPLGGGSEMGQRDDRRVGSPRQDQGIDRTTGEASVATRGRERLDLPTVGPSAEGVDIDAEQPRGGTQRQPVGCGGCALCRGRWDRRLLFARRRRMPTKTG